MNKPKKKYTNNSTIPLTLIAAGIVLILISLIWQLYESLSAENNNAILQPTINSKLNNETLPTSLQPYDYLTSFQATSMQHQKSNSPRLVDTLPEIGQTVISQFSVIMNNGLQSRESSKFI
jgi:hypothetical protein